MQVMTAKGISLLYKNKESKIYLRICFISYFILLVFSALNIDYKIATKNELYNPNEASFYITNIYSYNLEKVKNGNKIFDKEKLEIIKYVDENLRGKMSKENTEINTGILEKIWFYSWFSVKEDKSFYEKDNRDIKDFIDSNKTYLIYFFKSENEEIMESKEYKILYQNSAGAILTVNI